MDFLHLKSVMNMHCHKENLSILNQLVEEESDRIFDETAVVGVQEFASRLQAGIVPNYARWADFVAGSEIPKEIKKKLIYY